MRRLLAGPCVMGAVAMLSACGGGDSGSTAPSTAAATPTPVPTPTPSSSCSLRSRQDWVAAQTREWYLFPETLPAALDPSSYASVDDYVDALTATARSQGRDRYFTYVTSIAEENAYYEKGEEVSLGVRLATDPTGRRLFVLEAFEGGGALAAGPDRGTEIVAIGTSTANLRNVSAIADSEGLSGVSDALGPDTEGTTRTLRISNASVTRTVTVTKRAFDLTPISSRNGTRVIDYAGHRIGYVALRTFILTADPALRSAFAQFRAQGITEIVVDFRYNGGGLVSIAGLMGDLLGGGRSASDVFSYQSYRPEKASENETRTFRPQPESVAATRVAFIGTRSTASASELVINALVPYLGNQMALIGENTYGKPVGQIALDRSECNDRLRVIAFATQNSARQGNYFNGLVGTVPRTCQALDDVNLPAGDANEGMTRQALNFIVGASCTPISVSSGASPASIGEDGRRNLLIPDRPSTAQREVPGLF